MQSWVKSSFLGLSIYLVHSSCVATDALNASDEELTVLRHLKIEDLNRESGIREIREVLKSSNPKVRLAAIQAIGRFDREASVLQADVARAVEDADAVIRAAALEVLVRIASEKPLLQKILITATADSNPQIRRDAIEYLTSTFGRATPDEVWERMLRDRIPEVRAATIDGLKHRQQIPATCTGLLWRDVQSTEEYSIAISPDFSIKLPLSSEAFLCLARFSNLDAQEPNRLREFQTNSRDEKVRTAVAVGRLILQSRRGVKESQCPEIQALQKSRNVRNRWYAVRLLETLTDYDDRAWAWLVDAVGDTSEFVHVQAGFLLDHCPDRVRDYISIKIATALENDKATDEVKTRLEILLDSIKSRKKMIEN